MKIDNFFTELKRRNVFKVGAAYLIEIAQHSQRGILVTRVSFSRSAKRRHKCVVA